jgi:hypothetical protein
MRAAITVGKPAQMTPRRLIAWRFPPLLFPANDRPGFDFYQHFLEVDTDVSKERGRPRMRAQIRLEFLKEAVHLVAHIETAPGRWAASD